MASASAGLEVKAQCLIHPEAVVCIDAKLLGAGKIKIGEGTVIHPASIINAKAGPIEIGKFNIIEEQVEIINTSTSSLVIGNQNTFEVASKILGGGGKVGNANVFECKSEIGAGAKVSDGCTLGVGAKLAPGEELEPETVIVGPSNLRHTEEGAKGVHVHAIMKHIEVLRETLPRCHHLKKSGK
eukprot:TRINITY_DN51846_c0_g1_i1.p1 TRINITY_DN51846_c0_g1~~TRINITY_DN51846_c0_g1_i1.p1  ORF type:complete len:184 (-),score=35.58 TRINITY_DN51846_c0_g1_i1:107-658(-)